MSGCMRLDRLAVCRGLDPARPGEKLAWDRKTGTYHVARADNVDILPGGGVARRGGFRRVAAGAFHSLWSRGRSEAFAGVDDRLVRIVPQAGETGGVTIETLASGLTPGAALSFAEAAGCVYYANGREKGVIADGRAGPWSGPATGQAPADVVEPPAGHLLEHYAGRLFIAREDTVFFTRGAGSLHLMDPAGGFLPRRGGRVRLLAAVDDGLYVGTDTEVFFAAGRDPAQFVYRRVMDLPPIPGTRLGGPGIDLSAVAGLDLPDAAVVWADARGLCLGRAGGRVARLARLPLPGLGRGVAVDTPASWLFLLFP